MGTSSKMCIRDRPIIEKAAHRPGGIIPAPCGLLCFYAWFSSRIRINTSVRASDACLLYTSWDADEMWAALASMEDPILHLAVHLTLVGALREGEVAGLTPEGKEKFGREPKLYNVVISDGARKLC